MLLRVAAPQSAAAGGGGRDAARGSDPRAAPPAAARAHGHARARARARAHTHTRRRACARAAAGAGGSRGGASGATDLKKIPGVGAKNEALLVAKGLDSIAALEARFADASIGANTRTMVSFLTEDVGIVHKSHCRNIAEYIASKAEEADKAGTLSAGISAADRITFAVEGNISVGKTTFLKKIFEGHEVELQELVQIVPEPVESWQALGSGKFNMLDAFYDEPERYAYTFQNYVFVTRALQESKSRASSAKPLRLLERSVFSDRMVFVRAVHEARWMNEMELELYDSWFDPMVSAMPGLVPDAFIYLRADPDTCLQRLANRGRSEEAGVSHEYLQGLHDKHEEWFRDSRNERERRQVLFPAGGVPEGYERLAVSPGAGFGAGNSGLPSDIADSVLYLGNDNASLPDLLNNVPALVLDCNEHIDFDADELAKAAYRNKVKAFFEYVKTSKAQQLTALGGAALAAVDTQGLVHGGAGGDASLLMQAGSRTAMPGTDEWYELQQVLMRNAKTLGPYAPEWLKLGVEDMRQRM